MGATATHMTMRPTLLMCPECNEQHIFSSVGRTEPRYYSCHGCGNIEKHAHCPQCGCTTNYTYSPWPHHSQCASCGCGKPFVFD